MKQRSNILKFIKMTTLLWLIPVVIFLAILLGITIGIIPEKKLLIIEKWIKAWKGKSRGQT
jgi:uncharacterized membrane protein